MPQPLTPLAPLEPRQPMAPLRPIAPLAPLPRLAPLEPLGPGQWRPSNLPTAEYDEYDDGSQLATLPAPPPPPPEPPVVVNLGLSKSPMGVWGGIPLPTPRGPVPLPRPSGGGNKASGYAVWIVALLVAMASSGLFKFAGTSSDDEPDVSIPSVSVSIPPINLGGPKQPANDTEPGRAQPIRSGRTVVLNGSFDGQRIRVTLSRWVDNATPTNTFLDAPEAGKRLVAAQFRVTNTGSFPYVASATSSAHVIDTKGRTYPAVFLFDPLRQGKEFENVVSLSTGQAAAGYVAFEVPKNVRIKKVQFSGGSGGSGQTGTWTFVR